MELTLRDRLTEAIGYWEPRRIVYNLVLAAVVIAHALSDWRQVRSQITVNGLLFLFVLAVLANVAYCAAYVVDVFAQSSGYHEVWTQFRWILFAIGVCFAAVLTHFFSFALIGA